MESSEVAVSSDVVCTDRTSVEVGGELACTSEYRCLTGYINSHNATTVMLVQGIILRVKGRGEGGEGWGGGGGHAPRPAYDRVGYPRLPESSPPKPKILDKTWCMVYPLFDLKTCACYGPQVSK